MDNAKFLRAAFFQNTSFRTASGSPTTVQQIQVGCLFFDFAPPRAFDFDQKFTQELYTNNSLLPPDKTISILLEFINHVLAISQYEFEKHLLLSEKLTQSVAH